MTTRWVDQGLRAGRGLQADRGLRAATVSMFPADVAFQARAGYPMPWGCLWTLRLTCRE
jgi:hypothetical protein